MNNFIFLIRFGNYMLLSTCMLLRLKYLRRFKTEEEVNKFVESHVLGWANHLIKCTGAKIKVNGIENIPERNCLFVGNHQGYFDIPLLMHASKRCIGFVAKKEMINVPIVSQWMKAIRCVFLDRDNVREAIKQINEGVDYLKQGYDMAIFPEGTRSRSEKMGEFKKGSLKLGIKSGVPIIPVAISGTYKIYEETKKIKKPEVTITFCKPIYTSELSKEDQNSLAESVREIIKNELPKIK